MKKRENFTPVFIFFFVLSILLLGLIRFNFLGVFWGALGDLFLPAQKFMHQSFQSIFNLNKDEDVRKLKEENIDLIRQLVNQKKLEKDNLALRDQFQTTVIRSLFLLPARIIGAPNFVPGISEPSAFILDKGASDGVRLHQAVIYKDNLVGEISEVTQSRSKVRLITSASFSFPAKSLRNNTLGVVSGQGGRQMLFKNIIQEADIKEGDLIVSKGNEELKEGGFPPDLVIGKIVSIEKKPSALFQSANIISNLDFSSLTTVFIISQ